MRNKIYIFIMSLFFLLFYVSRGFALKEDSHKAINEYIAQKTVSGFSLSAYLINNLGFKGGSDEVLKGINAEGRDVEQKVLWWLGYGGVQEDRPGEWEDFVLGPTRSVNHFHNPLKPWGEAGLSDISSGMSSVYWAQEPNQFYGGQWSWQTARSAYYNALTGPDKAGRERYFAKTFRAVGQLMHLVEDASVPEHTRNDAHGVNFSERI